MEKFAKTETTLKRKKQWKTKLKLKLKKYFTTEITLFSGQLAEWRTFSKNVVSSASTLTGTADKQACLSSSDGQMSRDQEQSATRSLSIIDV